MRENITIRGISETHWKGKGHFSIADHTIYIASAIETRRNYVAIIVKKMQKLPRDLRNYNDV